LLSSFCILFNVQRKIVTINQISRDNKFYYFIYLRQPAWLHGRKRKLSQCISWSRTRNCCWTGTRSRCTKRSLGYPTECSSCWYVKLLYFLDLHSELSSQYKHIGSYVPTLIQT